MPGLEGDLEEWQTQEVNVINIHSFSSCEMTDSDTLGLHVDFSDEL